MRKTIVMLLLKLHLRLTSEWSESEGHSHCCPVYVEGEAGHVTVT